MQTVLKIKFYTIKFNVLFSQIISTYFLSTIDIRRLGSHFVFFIIDVVFYFKKQVFEM